MAEQQRELQRQLQMALGPLGMHDCSSISCRLKVLDKV